MATIKTYIFKRKMKQDGTWPVYIAVTHGSKTHYLPTSVFVDKRDLTPSFKIKNGMVEEKLERLIHEYRKRLYSLDVELNDMDLPRIVRLITRRVGGDICVSDYFDGVWVAQNARKKGLRNYMSAMNAYKTFLCRSTVMASDITVRNMRAFEVFLQDRPRAVSLYCSCVSKIFGDARMYYNDEDNGVISIRHSLSTYHAPRQNVARKRALSVEDIRRIFNLPYDGEGKRGRQSLHDLALDCFRLSFCLLGMNSADLWAAADIKDGVISYCREKTKDRRNDQAFMQVRIPDCVKAIADRHGDTERVFDFHRRYSNFRDFNRALNMGLKSVGAQIGIERLQFYAARHSMASIAVNKAGIDRWTVNAMLNHTDMSMRVTELYIERDFEPLNAANRKLLAFVFPRAADAPSSMSE